MPSLRAHTHPGYDATNCAYMYTVLVGYILVTNTLVYLCHYHGVEHTPLVLPPFDLAVVLTDGMWASQAGRGFLAPLVLVVVVFGCTEVTQ